jgi:hypothetical protein
MLLSSARREMAGRRVSHVFRESAFERRVSLIYIPATSCLPSWTLRRIVGAFVRSVCFEADTRGWLIRFRKKDKVRNL